MILSEDHKFIFVHIPKTGGSSVSFALRPYSRKIERSVLRSFSRRFPITESPLKAHFRVHDTASKIISKLGQKTYGEFQSFAVVRNPFASAVSHYEYMKQFRSAAVADRFAQMSFVDYLRFRASKGSWWTPRFARMPNQSHFVIDKQGNLAVNHVLKMENLQADFSKMCETVGLPDITLTRRNKTKAAKKSTEVYFNQETIGLIQSIYAPDFDMFGYSKYPPSA